MSPEKKEIIKDTIKEEVGGMADVKSLKYRRSFRILVYLCVVMVLIYLLKVVGFLDGMGVVWTSLQALFFGALISFVLNPVVVSFEKIYTKLFSKKKPRQRLVRSLSVATAEIILVVIIVLLISIVVPQMAISLNQLLPSFSDLVENFNDWMYNFSDSEMWRNRVYPAITYFTGNLSSWVLSTFGENSDVFKAITGSLMSAISIILNIFIGLILSIYLLIGKEKLYAHIKKLSTAIFKEKGSEHIMETVDKIGEVFSGFFAGKVIEALYVGLLCFVCMCILNLPYATIVSVVVGVTNIIPFFGQYIGAFVGIILELLVDPGKVVIFLIFIIILMQVDGNVIGPKVIGSHTGLPSLWVVVSILFFGGCFGFFGTLLGVPVFAIIYYIVKRLAEHSLKLQGLPIETREYFEDKDEEDKDPSHI